jgi:exodeoxyribonuclease V beta subunit
VKTRVLDPEAVLAFPLTGMRLIEASAGTGKTYTIANLYLRHIVAGREVGEVLVVTFTVAATDELRGRIRARLFEALGLLEQGGETKDAFLQAMTEQIRAQGQQELAAKRLRLAVRSMDEAAVYTIHSFCQRALSEFAFNSGQPFRMEVIAGDHDLWHGAIRDWWRRAGYPLDPARLRLFSTALEGVELFAERLQPLLGAQQRHLLPEVEDLDSVLGRFDELAPELRSLASLWRQEGEHLKGILLDFKGLSRNAKKPYHPDALAVKLAAIDDYFSAEDGLPPPQAFRVLSAETIDQNRLKTTDPSLSDPFFTRCRDLWQRLEDLRRDLLPAALADAAAFVRARVREAKQRARVLSFDDLLTEMHAALQGQSGAALADSIRDQFPVAMIDEFQDTDPVQYGVFRRLYPDRPDCGLIMIGDPKQAIYSFRGGDIFTYMQAKEDVGREGIYTLGTNWRSTPEVIRAVNALFGHRDDRPFVYGDAIPYYPIGAADKQHRRLTDAGRPQPALTLWTLPMERNAKGQERPPSKERARDLAHQAVAVEIARLIAGGRAGTTRLDDQPLTPKDIAVLVRTGFEAAELRKVLAALGIPAVSVERQGVFQSDEAAALEALLAAVLDPRDRDAARLALASPLLGKNYAELERLLHSEDDWAAWIDELLELHETWQRKGFMAMFQGLLRSVGIAAAAPEGQSMERRLTNLLHLGELLQQTSKAHGGMDALLTWLRRQRQQPGTEEAELRLESDEELVQIVTVHAAKGLEYPVVFVPYLWDCRTRAGDLPLAFHRDGQACLDAGSDQFNQHLVLAEQERLAEDVRLVYVALTRAESALYLAWGRAGTQNGHAGQTALGYLLHPHQSGERLAQELPDAFAGLDDLGPDLRRLADAAGGNIVVEPLPEHPEPPVGAAEPALPPLAPRPFHGRIASDWRIASFSALTKEVHSGPAPSREGMEDDVALRFPAGSHVGSYLHLLLEKLDFQGDIEAQVLGHSAQIAPRFNLCHEALGRDAAALLERATRTPLDDTGLTLAQVSCERRLNELEFDFATGPASFGLLDRLLEQAAGQPLPPLQAETFRGMVNGVIDLVLEHRERFYIADYKSNFLGGQLADYRRERLRQAVFERRYDLQYLLYTLALHRYLGRRLPGYDYRRHFGGVYYLFLRGMHPETGASRGVYFDLPAPSLIEALDRQVFPCDGLRAT